MDSKTCSGVVVGEGVKVSVGGGSDVGVALGPGVAVLVGVGVKVGVGGISGSSSSAITCSTLRETGLSNPCTIACCKATTSS